MPGTSTEQVVDKGIRQKSIHSFHSIHSFPDGSAFCPGAPKRVPSDSEKHRRVYTSSNVCHSHEWRVDTASGMTLKKQNACLHAVRHAVEKKLRVYTASEAKGLPVVVACYLLCKVQRLYQVIPELGTATAELGTATRGYAAVLVTLQKSGI